MKSFSIIFWVAAGFEFPANNQRSESISTCAARANRRFEYNNDPIYHVCMMDTDLYLEEYNPYGTSIFSYAKVQELSVKYHPHGNDLIFGYPSPDCGCFPGCNDFLTPSGVHHTNFCCSDWQSICVNPPNLRVVYEHLKTKTSEFIALMEARNSELQAVGEFKKNSIRSIRKKFRRITTKLNRNLSNTGEIICSKSINIIRSHTGDNLESDPKRGHLLVDKWWHLVDHYFAGCDLQPHHLNRVDKMSNRLTELDIRLDMTSIIMATYEDFELWFNL